MKNADKPATPLCTGTESGTYNGQTYTKCFIDSEGLTKREYAAIKIMSGFASAADITGTVEEISEYAVEWADALLKELEK